MSDTAESGNIKGSFVEDENKVKIETIYCVKNEPNEEALYFEVVSHTKQCRITPDCENIFGEPSHQIKIEENSDNLIDLLDNDVKMENEMIKLEAVKEEDDGSFNNFQCSKCKDIYKGYGLKCSTLLCILNNNSALIKSESNIPTDILEIRESTREKGVYLLTTLPMNIIFGPFDGILGIESTVGYSWKIIDNKLKNIKSGNWMKNIVCAPSASLKNLDIFQVDGNLYFQTNREITEDEELFIYYNDEELQQLDNSDECLYTPQKQEKLPKIFACTVCCLGFGSNKSLIEHKRKCCRMEHSRTMKDFVLIECHYCKMWMEKWEHDEYHVAYCLEKHHRMRSDNLAAINRSDTCIEEMQDDCGTKNYKRTYNRRDNLQFDTKDYQCFSGSKHVTFLSECVLTEHSNEQIRNTIEPNNESHLNHLNKHRGIKPFKCDICMTTFIEKRTLKRHIKYKHGNNKIPKDYKCSECPYEISSNTDLQKHLNTHRGIKPFKCDICMMTFIQKGTLNRHIKCKHADNGSAKDYKCPDCSYQTNYKTVLQKHLNTHKGIKPFKCDICAMEFGQNVQIKRHIRDKHTHVGNAKDYKCLECTYQTNYKADLEKHLNKHRDIKPFKCDICMMEFIQKGNLNRHIKYKHADSGSAKDYKCLECSYQTNSKTNLQNHLNKHRGIKPFKCDICMTTFTQKSSLNTHTKNIHTTKC